MPCVYDVEMRWLHRFGALVRRTSRVGADQPDGSNGPESEIRRRVTTAGEIAIREIVPLGGGKQLIAKGALADLYFQQRSVLEDRFKQEGVSVFIADYGLATLRHAPAFSYCVWTQGVLSLLPEAEFVVLSGVATKTRDYWEAIVPWSEFLRVTGDACIVREPDLVPVRWRAVMWPDRRMLQQLRATAVHF